MNENKTNETKVIASKKKKYSYTAMTSTALVIAAIIILNAIVGILGSKISLKLDLTKDSILTFSETTEKIIDSLETNVNFISLIPQSDTTREVIQIDEILKKYDQSSDKITYTRVDSKRNPAILSKYPLDGKPLDGDYYVIVESEKMHRAVSVDDLLMRYYHTDTNILTGALDAEPEFSKAIVKVTEGSDVKVLVSKGHGEKFTADNFLNNVFPGEGYEFRDIFLSSDDIADDTDVLVIASPKTDYSQEEISKIDEFSRNGGDIQIIADTDTEYLANLFGYMDEWGVSFANGVAADADAGNYSQNKVSIIGQIGKNDITGSMGIDGQITLFPFSRPVEYRQKPNVTVNVLASTGKNGYVKENIYFMDDSYKSGDKKGQSNLAVMATRQNSVDSASNLFVMGTSYFIGNSNDKTFDILYSTANRQFLVGIMDYMSDQPSSFYIVPKNIAQDKVVINQMSIYTYTMITVVFIPMALIAWGIITWIRRRHS